MEILNLIIEMLNKTAGFIRDLLSYKTVYTVTGAFFTRKFKKARHFHKYAVLVAARNEEAVIGNLIDSINKQDYPRELVTVFVVADNCTDSTAAVARKNGAVCYERLDTQHCTKGYALQFLVECIRRDYGIEAFEGYFLFDADNLLKQDYITRMNESFDEGLKIITSYRNAKNFGDNWISASYGLHWLRTIRKKHRARSLFHLATRIQGTGFLFANELIKNGWNYVSLTEDRAFCADAVTQGYQISYNHDAQFYDEQPVSLKIALRQRLRWAKGHLQAFAETGPTLFKHIFITKGMANKDCPNVPWYKKLFNNLRLRFMSLDVLSVVFPRSLFILLRRVLVYLLKFAVILMGGHFVFKIFKINIFGLFRFEQPLECNVLSLTVATLYTTIVSCFDKVLNAVYVFIIEARRIEYIPLIKKIWFCLTFPLFDIIGKYSLLVALFTKVEWKSIPHTAAVNIDDIKKGAKKKKA